MYYSYVEIEYVATSFSPARTDLALKLLKCRHFVLYSSMKVHQTYYITNKLFKKRIIYLFLLMRIIFLVLIFNVSHLLFFGSSVQLRLIGYQKIPCHMIFDVKMEDFRQKARLVAGGHLTEAPATIIYASVVSHETVHLALTFASLNDLEVKVGDVLNAYITTPVKEKVWTIHGPEFGLDSGKSAVIVRALYGLKKAGAAFWAHLASFMCQMGYTSCNADPDMWLKAVTRPEDNVRYYAYILCYVDNILCIHHDPMSVMGEINK
jgi:hypothetical protein